MFGPRIAPGVEHLSFMRFKRRIQRRVVCDEMSELEGLRSLARLPVRVVFSRFRVFPQLWRCLLLVKI